MGGEGKAIGKAVKDAYKKFLEKSVKVGTALILKADEKGISIDTTLEGDLEEIKKKLPTDEPRFVVYRTKGADDKDGTALIYTKLVNADPKILEIYEKYLESLKVSFGLKKEVAVSSIGDIIGDIVTAGLTTLSAVLGSFAGTAGSVVGDIVEGAADVIGSVIGTVSSGSETVGDIVGTVVDTAADVASKAIDVVENVAGGVWDAVTDFFGGDDGDEGDEGGDDGDDDDE